MREYGCEMQREIERAKAEREERRLARFRRVLRLIMRFVGYVIGVMFMAILGALVWICTLFPDYECERIFGEWGLIWAR